MKSHTCILLQTLCLAGVCVTAQTPFDSFASETSRPMLGLDAINMMEKPSLFLAILKSKLRNI